jgi:pimeloyl-ACP methyl ester carboxylesterase
MNHNMLKFQPAGFGQKSAATRLGKVAYYRPVETHWQTDWQADQSKGDLPTHLASANLAREGSENQKQIVIFFHNFGGGASAYEWSKVYAFLSAAYTVVAPDLIGWGASDHPQRQYSTQDYLNNIEDFIQQISSAPIVAVASSFTAGLVARLATQRPQLFDRLFLSCPAGFRDFGISAGRRIPEPIINAPFLDKAIYALGATNELAVRSFLENFLLARRDRLTPETVLAYLTSAQQPGAEYAALSFLRGDLYFDLAPYLAKIQVPTAIVWGEKAQFTPVALGQRLANSNPTAIQRFQVISETGILPHLEQPGIVAALLLDWLQAAGSITHLGQL